MSTDEFVRALLEAKYVEILKHKYPDADERTFFPMAWYQYRNDDKKIDFLKTAIEEGKFLSECEGLVVIQEGVENGNRPLKR